MTPPSVVDILLFVDFIELNLFPLLSKFIQITCLNFPVSITIYFKIFYHLKSFLFKEVEYARRLLARFLTHTHITKVSYPDADGLSKRFTNCTPDSFADSLVNRKISDIKRHGKYLWFEMADKKALTPIFHFGMSGGFRIKSAPDVTYLTELKRTKMKAKNEVDGQCESFVYGYICSIDLFVHNFSFRI